jgi:Glycosyl transferases group 1
MTEVPGETEPDRQAPAGGTVDVVGVGVPAEVAEAIAPRPHVVIVTEAWGSNSGERLTATRLIAGAVALRAQVSIVSIDDRSEPRARQPRLRHDGVFPVYSVAAPPGLGRLGGVPSGDQVDRKDLGSDLIRASLSRQPGDVLPEPAAQGLITRYGLPSSDALKTAVDLRPDVVVLAGPATFWMAIALPAGAARPRVVLLPLCGDDAILSSLAFRPFADHSDAIGALSGVEARRIAEQLPAEVASLIHRVRVALPINPLALAAHMAGVQSFGTYVLLISGFSDDPANGRCPPHDYLREVFGDIAIAEVRRGGWLVTGAGRRFDVTWAPTRVNMWRLMARAALTVDLRSQGPVGRETIESLLFGTPVVVPEGSVSAEHAAESNGGLWYRNRGEMVDCVRTLLEDEELRLHLAHNGQSWAQQHHGDTESFVGSVIRLIIGPPADEEAALRAGVGSSSSSPDQLGDHPVEDVGLGNGELAETELVHHGQQDERSADDHVGPFALHARTLTALGQRHQGQLSE